MVAEFCSVPAMVVIEAAFVCVVACFEGVGCQSYVCVFVVVVMPCYSCLVYYVGA